MSVKNVKAFFEKVERDKRLQERLKPLAEKSEVQGTAAVAELVKIAAAAGFKFTATDYVKARTQAAGELSEAELKAVKGSVPGCPCGYKCGLLIRF